MTKDAILVALMRQAMDGRSRHRRIAAGILLDVLRSSQDADALSVRTQIAEARDGEQIALEMRQLLQEFGLDQMMHR